MKYKSTNHKCTQRCVLSSLSDHYCLISFNKSKFSAFFPHKLAPGEMTPTTATRRQLWRPGQAHLSTHTGKKYPVRGITPLTLIIKIDPNFMFIQKLIEDPSILSAGPGLTAQASFLLSFAY